MKDWLVLGLIFLLLMSLPAGAKWQLMVSPAQEGLREFCMIGYSWDVEPFTVALHLGASMNGEAYLSEMNSYTDESLGHYMEVYGGLLIPAVNLRIEKLDYQKRVVPFFQIRYARDLVRVGGGDLDIPWLPRGDAEELELDEIESSLIYEFFRVGGGVRLKVSDSFSILGEYGIDVRLVKFDQQGYEKKTLVFDERIRGVCPNTYGGVTLVWQW